MQGEQWREWLRRSPVGLDLFARWQQAGEFLALLGPDGYRQSLLELLSRAEPRDCAAAGFGCTRRVDRACRAPEVCSLDPGAGPPREGPVPGACDAFWGYYGNDLRLQVRFSGRSGHRAVSWTDGQDPARLWVDGVPVGPEHVLESSGYWVGGRFFVADAQGPDEHPAQRYVPGELVTTILSVLIHDAEERSTLLLVPEPHELWTDPCVRHHGGILYVYPDPAARDADRPDRRLPAR
jgi:hypothetical protein